MGTSLTETLLAIGIGVLILLGVVLGLQQAMEKKNQGETIQAIYLLRNNIDTMYAGSSYDGLDNAIIISAELAPKTMIRSNSLRSAYGAVTVAGAGGQYTIALDDLTKAACQQVSRISADSWSSIEVNGTEVLDADEGTVPAADLIAACSTAKNSVIFTTP